MMSSKYSIRNIVFDLGGVLVDWNPVNVYQDVFKENTDKMDWFFENVCNDAWNLAQDAGRTFEEGEAILIGEFPEYEHHIRLFSSNWHRMFSGIIPENVALFKKLIANGNSDIYALTNWSAEKWPQALELFPFFSYFKGAVVSGMEKTVKPEAKIYRILLDRYNLVPEQTLFIDDKKENIVAAEKLGIHGLHYSSDLLLDHALKAFSIPF